MKTKTFLALLSVGALGASAASVGSNSVSEQENSFVRAPLPGNVDPRLQGLPVSPEAFELQSTIDELAATDRQFAAGLKLFDRDFHDVDGLGTPELNADSCRACHQDPVIGGAGGLELNVSRFADDNLPDGPFINLPGGQGLSKLRSPNVPGREEYDTATATVFEQRQTPSVLGAGLIDTIPEMVILSNEDILDANGDGIFGYARMIDVAGVMEVGRFGWKAQVPRLGDFSNDAMAGEIGVTTPDNGRGFALLTDADGIPDPELNQKEVNNLTHFMANLPAPQRKGSTSPLVVEGEQHFDTIGCAKCHTPRLAGLDGPVELYSNLLVHNVMPSDYRGMEEPGAPAGFFRTPPLWGISDTAPYMHDGRAATLLDAIYAHDGEAAGVVVEFDNMTQERKDAVILFLEDL